MIGTLQRSNLFDEFCHIEAAEASRLLDLAADSLVNGDNPDETRIAKLLVLAGETPEQFRSRCEAIAETLRHRAEQSEMFAVDVGAEI